jgi:hypothetical protein
VIVLFHAASFVLSDELRTLVHRLVCHVQPDPNDLVCTVRVQAHYFSFETI